MAKNPQSKDEALEAVDFIVNVLKEHERDLDKLINELATVTEQMGETGELGDKVEKVEEKITTLQKEVASLVGYVSGAPKEAPAAVPTGQPVQAFASVAMQSGSSGPVIVLRCKVWEDFQNLATGAQTLSFSYKEEEKLFQVDALKGNTIINYSGPLPKYSTVLKAFLSKELGVSERSILEGVLAIG